MANELTTIDDIIRLSGTTTAVSKAHIARQSDTAIDAVEEVFIPKIEQVNAEMSLNAAQTLERTGKVRRRLAVTDKALEDVRNKRRTLEETPALIRRFMSRFDSDFSLKKNKRDEAELLRLRGETARTFDDTMQFFSLQSKLRGQQLSILQAEMEMQKQDIQRDTTVKMLAVEDIRTVMDMQLRLENLNLAKRGDVRAERGDVRAASVEARAARAELIQQGEKVKNDTADTILENVASGRVQHPSISPASAESELRERGREKLALLINKEQFTALKEENKVRVLDAFRASTLDEFVRQENGLFKRPGADLEITGGQLDAAKAKKKSENIVAANAAFDIRIQRSQYLGASIISGDLSAKMADQSPSLGSFKEEIVNQIVATDSAAEAARIGLFGKATQLLEENTTTTKAAMTQRIDDTFEKKSAQHQIATMRMNGAVIPQDVAAQAVSEVALDRNAIALHTGDEPLASTFGAVSDRLRNEIAKREKLIFNEGDTIPEIYIRNAQKMDEMMQSVLSMNNYGPGENLSLPGFFQVTRDSVVMGEVRSILVESGAIPDIPFASSDTQRPSSGEVSPSLYLSILDERYAADIAATGADQVGPVPYSQRFLTMLKSAETQTRTTSIYTQNKSNIGIAFGTLTFGTDPLRGFSEMVRVMELEYAEFSNIKQLGQARSELKGEEETLIRAISNPRAPMTVKQLENASGRLQTIRALLDQLDKNAAAGKSQ